MPRLPPPLRLRRALGLAASSKPWRRREAGHDSGGTSVSIPAARCVRVFQVDVPRKIRGRRESRVFCAPVASCAAKKHTSKYTTGPPKQSGLPCAMAYDLWRALPGVRDLIVTVACRFVTRRLSTSPGVPGPHVFAVRFGRARRTRHHVHRIPPRVRDDREPPLLPRRDA